MVCANLRTGTRSSEVLFSFFGSKTLRKTAWGLGLSYVPCGTLGQNVTSRLAQVGRDLSKRSATINSP